MNKWNDAMESLEFALSEHDIAKADFDAATGSLYKLACRLEKSRVSVVEAARTVFDMHIAGEND